eukprot:GHRR01012658.1.p1 GENE.GHRR01012658.1~~GHRR01012658.1.p1  ORF type:complete len:362 (+),score=154.95 GHRR01012658.1:620-1705(+)
MQVYSKAGERFDPTKRGGRFKPEFIWQTNWQEQLKRQEDLERQQQQYKQRQQAGAAGKTGPGVVSFSRLGALDDLNVDLTQQLIEARERQQQLQAKAAATPAPTSSRQQPAASISSSSSSIGQHRVRQQQVRQQPRRAATSPSYQYKDLPTRVEARRFQRQSRSAGINTVASISAVGGMTPEEAVQRAAAAALEKQRYERLKVDFQAWTIALGLLGTVTCLYLYSQDVAISYALGASGGLTYLRLLSRTVDAVGDQGAVGGAITAIGQPRLLVPVLLALTYNRWNMLYADQFGYHLDLYAMLVGFFTYKLAVLGRQGLELLSELTGSQNTDTAGSSGMQTSDDGNSAMTLDRIFIKKALSE